MPRSAIGNNLQCSSALKKQKLACIQFPCLFKLSCKLLVGITCTNRHTDMLLSTKCTISSDSVNIAGHLQSQKVNPMVVVGQLNASLCILIELGKLIQKLSTLDMMKWFYGFNGNEWLKLCWCSIKHLPTHSFTKVNFMLIEDRIDNNVCNSRQKVIQVLVTVMQSQQLQCSRELSQFQMHKCTTECSHGGSPICHSRLSNGEAYLQF